MQQSLEELLPEMSAQLTKPMASFTPSNMIGAILVASIVVCIVWYFIPPAVPKGISRTDIKDHYAEIIREFKKLPSMDNSQFKAADNNLRQLISNTKGLIRAEYADFNGKTFSYRKDRHSHHSCYGTGVLGCRLGWIPPFHDSAVMIKIKKEGVYQLDLMIDYDYASMLPILEQ